jgi:hypothetical protein
MRMLAYGQYEAGLCDCGYHESLATDPSNHFTFEEKVCPVCRGSARYGRIQQAADEAATKARGEHAPPAMPHPADGRRTFARKLGDHEVAELRAGRKDHSAPTR